MKSFKGVSSIALSALAAFPAVALAQNSDVLFDQCNVQDYYAGLLSSDGSRLRDDISRADLETLLETTHRKVLPYTASDRDDVWKALIDLDPGSEPDTVKLIYRQVDTPARPYGTAQTWNREHLWPKSWGVEYSGSDFTDIHHLRPADWNVNSARNNLYFGSCGLMEPLSECQSPAHPEAASDTAADGVVFLPPENMRGDIARAIFYMDIRYSNQNNDGLDLTVTDCPSEKPNEMAYKSQLLEWHMSDPVSEEERQRNQLACSRFQGNRNVFVDFPELVEIFFGTPQTSLGEGMGYPGCENVENDNTDGNDSTNPISSPTPASPSTLGTSCETLMPGDVMMVGFNSDNPEVIGLVALENLLEGLELFLTDNAWTGSSFRSNEGTISLRVPAGAIDAGTVFGYGSSADLLYSGDWESAGGRFQLSTSGDSLILFCRNADATIRFLSAFDFSGNGWMQSNQGEDTYGTSDSALPEALSDSGAIVSVPHFDNYVYSGPIEGTKVELLAALTDPSHWDGNNEPDSAASFPEFQLQSSTSIPAPSPSPSSLSAGDVMVVAINSMNPDLVALVTLTNLTGGTQLYLTDNAWTGSSFRANEGTLVLTIPNGGISAGTIFGYGSGLLYGEEWQQSGGRFALAESGDTVIIYVQNKDGEVRHLGAFSYTGGDWKESGLVEEDYGSDNSGLPGNLLLHGAINLPHFDNYLYAGPIEGNVSFLQSSLQDGSNWEGSNADPVSPPTRPFIINASSATLPSSWPAWILGIAQVFGFFISHF